jgi:hypothetical protein
MVILMAAAAAVASMQARIAEHVNDPGSWFSASDFDPQNLDKASITTFDVTIDAAGKPIRCDIIIPSGSTKIDAAVCSGVSSRAHFRPALDAKGMPIASVQQERVVWRPQGHGRTRWRELPDIVVQTDRLSGDETRSSRASLIVDQSGAVERCVILDHANDSTLDNTACDVVRNQGRVSPVLDERGASIRGMRSYIVGFEAHSQGGH